MDKRLSASEKLVEQKVVFKAFRLLMDFIYEGEAHTAFDTES